MKHRSPEKSPSKARSVVYMPAVVQFFVKVVDVPCVLCDGVPQVQFIDGYDVPVIMRGQRSAPHLAD